MLLSRLPSFPARSWFAGGLVVAMLCPVAISLDADETPAVTSSDAAASPPADPAELLRKFQDPQEFSRLCEECHLRNVEMNDRSRAVQHTEDHEITELDKQGKAVAAERHEERVWFVEGAEWRQSVRKLDALTGKPKAVETDPRKSPKNESIYPFSREAEPGMYDFRLEQVETIDERPALRVRFEPREPLDGKFSGTIWIDPVSANPVRFEGSMVKLPRFVSEIRVTIEFGPANNGQMQTRQSVVDVTGGLAFVQKRFRTVTQHSEYTPRAAKP